MVEQNLPRGSATYIEDADRLPDPCNDRVMKNVLAPPNRPLSIEKVFPKCDDGQRGEKINRDLIEEYLFEGGRLSKECLLELISRARQAFSAE